VGVPLDESAALGSSIRCLKLSMAIQGDGHDLRQFAWQATTCSSRGCQFRRHAQCLAICPFFSFDIN
jgi:hypothetical protein